MKILEGERKKENGFIIVAGDFNFLTDIKLDKKRGKINSGTT